MQVPFLPFPMTWGEAVMVMGLVYWVARNTVIDGAKAIVKHNRRRFWKTEVAKLRGHDA